MRFIFLLGFLIAGMAHADDAQEQLKATVVAALDSFAAECEANRLEDATAYAERLQTYLEAHPEFYGAAAALLDGEGNVVASPYVYRTEEGFETLDLAHSDYRIEEQEWVRLPLEANQGVWTEPYFDEGGGEIWMITRSVPARDAQGIFAIITTDLPADTP